jgi:hypothetical protein
VAKRNQSAAAKKAWAKRHANGERAKVRTPVKRDQSTAGRKAQETISARRRRVEAERGQKLTPKQKRLRALLRG